MLKPFMDFIVTIVDVMFAEAQGECGTRRRSVSTCADRRQRMIKDGIDRFAGDREQTRK